MTGSRGPISPKSLPALRLVTDATQPGTQPLAASDVVRPLAPEQPANLHSDLVPLWDMLCAELDGAGLLSRVDGLALHLALEHYRAGIEAAQSLAADGPTASGSMGQPIPNPASTVFARHTDAFVTLARQLGLTFASRARIALPDERPPEEKGNPFASGSSSAG